MKEKHENTTSGCEMMEKLWEAAKACNLDEPGITGAPGRIGSFITCSNIPAMMRLSALKCWEERTKVGTNPYALFTPLDLSEETAIANSNGNSSSSSKIAQKSGSTQSPAMKK